MTSTQQMIFSINCDVNWLHTIFNHVFYFELYELL